MLRGLEGCRLRDHRALECPQGRDGVEDQALSLKEQLGRGAWVAQSVKRPTSAQVMVSWFVSSNPMLGSMLSAQSLLWILSLCLSLSLSPSTTYVLSLSKTNIKKKKRALGETQSGEF